MFTDALFGPDEKLRGLILQVTAVGGSQASSKENPASLLGKSGPCRLHKELVTFDRWQSAISSILHAEDEDWTGALQEGMQRDEGSHRRPAVCCEECDG